MAGAQVHFVFWFQPEYTGVLIGTYPPAGYKFFPEGLTGTVGMDLPETMLSSR